MITVSPRARRHEDKAGDPLDGLVNLFDIGIVLAVAFLLAALASLKLTGALTHNNVTRTPKNTITIGPGDTAHNVPSSANKTVGRGTQVGTVYRLRDGRLVYVVPAGSPTPTSTP